MSLSPVTNMGTVIETDANMRLRSNIEEDLVLAYSNGPSTPRLRGVSR